MIEVGTDNLTTSFGEKIQILSQLGSGGQGTVFEAKLTPSGRHVALKWYSEGHQNQGVFDGIKYLTDRDSPSPHFLWPTAIVKHGGEFGYVMDIRPDSFAGIPTLLRRRVDASFSTLIEVSSHVVEAFRALQSHGLFYCDISDKNLFFQPGTGEVLICDNDNIGSLERAPTVLGTPRFMAPEIVRGERKPSPDTDRFSMAVLLFMVMFNDHPLQGKAESKIRCLDPVAMKQLYGDNPVFIFDPDDSSNAPDPDVQVNAPIFWKIYPQFVRDLYIKAFTVGLKSEAQRPSFREWQQMLARLKGSVCLCSSCGKENFIDRVGIRRSCWSCKKPVSAIHCLEHRGGSVVVLRDGVHVTAQQLSPRGSDTIVGVPQRHPSKDLLGLKNLSPDPWHVTSPSGKQTSVPPGRSMSLTPGAKVRIGDAEVKVGPTQTAAS